MNNERTEWTVLGRKIGTATGWDDLGDHDIILYDFLPHVEVDLPACDLGVLFEKGAFEAYDSEGNTNFYADIVNTLRDIARAA